MAREYNFQIFHAKAVIPNFLYESNSIGSKFLSDDLKVLLNQKDSQFHTEDEDPDFFEDVRTSNIASIASTLNKSYLHPRGLQLIEVFRRIPDDNPPEKFFMISKLKYNLEYFINFEIVSKCFKNTPLIDQVIETFSTDYDDSPIPIFLYTEKSRSNMLEDLKIFLEHSKSNIPQNSANMLKIESIEKSLLTINMNLQAYGFRIIEFMGSKNFQQRM